MLASPAQIVARVSGKVPAGTADAVRPVSYALTPARARDRGGRRADRSRATASLAKTVAAANRLALIEMSEAVRAGIGALACVLGSALGIA